MTYSRREFTKWAAAVSTLAVSTPRAKALSLVTGNFGSGYRPDLLPSQKETWDNLSWMAALGPKYTGNKAHVTYVNWLDEEMRKLGLEVTRDSYKLPLWEARRWEIKVQAPSGEVYKPKVTSYFPRSGQTSVEGITAPLVYAGSSPQFFNLKNCRGKIVLADFACASREWDLMYTQWGVCPKESHFPDVWKPARGGITNLKQFRDAGAVGVILAWTDVSDENAQDQYSPFNLPVQNIPALYVGKQSGIKLSQLASAGATATIVLEADLTPDMPTDSVMATLRGSSSEEAFVVHTHTDGPNATEENGGVALVALAKYFSKIPKGERRRDIVFPMHTGHFAGSPSVPFNVQGVLDAHPDLLPKTVAAITVEHLAAREWADDLSLSRYRPTGENSWNVTVTAHKSIADLALGALEGTSAVHQTAVVNPLHSNGWFGVGPPFGLAGIPAIQYIPQPNYLCVGAANCCIDKLSPELFHSQIEFFAKIMHKINSMTAQEIKGQ